MTENPKIIQNGLITNPPLVSIVTIVYNGEKYIKQCIESIINQDYNNIQYIVIDGESTDSTLDIINTYGKQIDILLSEKDRGISDAFNKGIAIADGEIIGLLNSDDLYTDGAIKAVVDSYIAHNCLSGVYYGDVIYFDNKVNIELVADASKLWRGMSIFHPATFITKDIYDKYGVFAEEYKYAMDSELIHKFLYNKVPFIHVKETLAKFRLAGTSDQNFFKSHREFYQSVKKYNYSLASEFFYRWNVFKKLILKTRFGQFLNKRRGSISWLLAGKMKSN
jgi:glycosyltransferase involved in cell wall biosynthesis